MSTVDIEYDGDVFTAKPRQIISSHLNDNVFSIGFDHYQLNDSQETLLMERQTWDKVFDPLYQTLLVARSAVHRKENSITVGRDHIEKAFQKTEASHSPKVNWILTSKKIVHSTDHLEDRGEIFESDTHYCHASKMTVNVLTDFAHQIADSVSKKGTKADELALHNWMVEANADYKPTSNPFYIFWRNKELYNLVERTKGASHSSKLQPQ